MDGGRGRCLADGHGLSRTSTLLDRRARPGEVVATPYHGGLLDRRGGHLHPLNYALGLARAATAAGVRDLRGVAGDRPGRSAGRRARRDARRGAVRAAPRRPGRRRPAARPLPARPRAASCRWPTTSSPPRRWPIPAALIPNDVAVSDSRFVVNYYRLDRRRPAAVRRRRALQPPPARRHRRLRPPAHGGGLSAAAPASPSTTPGAGWSRSP